MLLLCFWLVLGPIRKKMFYENVWDLLFCFFLFETLWCFLNTFRRNSILLKNHRSNFQKITVMDFGKFPLFNF